ncbi:hypothetical protein EKO27_g2899 [Xylaria grammica]|uniref:Rhodopsin domain-containing protein n=1 Tax=Xylaria grammica TaxID=363999 RepID=A0A439DCR3_9PEZI|nr:hypothetical protein EKO27_g2899 [Xylaria grammica]
MPLANLPTRARGIIIKMSVMVFDRRMFTPDQRPVITEKHAGPLLQILTWLFLSFAILSVATQSITRRATMRRFGASDIALFVALALTIGQMATVLCPAGQNIGNASSQLSPADVDGAFKALYSGDMLGIFSLAGVKGSILMALYVITPRAYHRVIIGTTGALIAVWAIAGAFAVAFQCPPPQRWNILNYICIDIRATRTFIIVLNIVTDVILIIIPSIIVVPTKMSWGKRLTILLGFWSRVGVIAASAVQLFYYRRLVFDETLLGNIWRAMIATEVVQVTSIITACIPFLKPFLMSLESGFLRADDMNRRHEGSSGSSRGRKPIKWTSSYIRIKNQQRSDRSTELNNLA